MSDLRTSLVQRSLRGAPIGSEELRRRVEADLLAGSPHAAPTARRGWAIAFAAAAAVLVIVGGFALVLGGLDDSSQPADIGPTTTAPAPSTAVEVVPSSGDWSPILAETAAKSTPAVVTCPIGAESSTRGAIDQARPTPGWVSVGAGALDSRTGQVVYVDVAGVTWLFDVCTDVWRPANTDGSPSGAIGPLVYDADSGVTVMIGEWVAVYDPMTNTWERRYSHLASPDGWTSTGFFGAVYDPISGLILTSGQSITDPETWELRAYDVDLDSWFTVGSIAIDRNTPCCTPIDLLGYSSVLDRLILSTSIDNVPATLLIDPRTGDMTIIHDDSTPVIDLAWPNHTFGQANGTVWVHVQTDRALRTFDTAAAEWISYPLPVDIPSEYVAFAAIVDDTLNHRILLVNGIYGNWGANASDDLWALDITTGDWTQVLAGN